MATAKKEKTTVSKTVKKASTGKKTTKKSATIEQIEKLEKVLKDTKEQDIINLVPDEIKADVKEERAELANFEDEKRVDFESEVKKIIESVEPSDEVKEQVDEFEKAKEDFNEKLEKEPEQAEKHVQEEIERIETIKKKVETMKANLQKENKRIISNEGFTNWWNGSSSLY